MSVITDAIGGLLGPVKDIIGEVVVDPNKRDKINQELQQLGDLANSRLHDELMAQMTINNTEAGSSRLFIAGWRPFIGWTGGVGLGWNFVLSPLVGFLASLAGWHGIMPATDSAQLMTLVMAMLGVGAMRSYDKMKGTSVDVLHVAPAKDIESQTILQDLHSSIPDKAPWAK